MPVTWNPLSFVGDIAGAAINAKSVKDQQNRQFEMDQALMNQQHTRNVDFWNMQNAYNSPSSQMGRLKDAGLNPAMLYGKMGGGLSGNAGSISPVTPQRTKALNSTNAALAGLMAFQDIRLRNAQADNVKADTDKKKEESAWIHLKAVGEKHTNLTKELEANFQDEVYANKVMKFQSEQQRTEVMRLSELQNYNREKFMYEAFELAMKDPETFKLLSEYEIARLKYGIAHAKNEQEAAQYKANENEWYTLQKNILPAAGTTGKLLQILLGLIK